MALALTKRRGEREEHEQEFKCGGIVLDRLFVLAQRERLFRVVERVTDGRCRWLGLFLAADEVS